MSDAAGVTPRGGRSGGALRRLHPLRIDAPLPPHGLARWATVAGLACGGLVAGLVVVFFLVVVWGAYAG
jgi:hypothetical protein